MKVRHRCLAGCGNEIKRQRQKSCSIFCSLLVRRKPRRTCLNGCENQVRNTTSQYCSLRCVHAHRHRARAQAFINGGGTYGHVPGHFLARVLRDFYGECCMKCGWAQRHEKTGKVPVEVEHIDGNWENNLLDNLMLLCPNCHALTSTFRGLNRGRGRARRLGGRANPIAGYRAQANLSQTAAKGFATTAEATAIVAADVAKWLTAPLL